MDRRIRLTALMLAASLLLNMVVLPVHGQEDTAPSSAQVSQENEPTEVPTETAPAPPQTTVPSTTVETQAPTVPEETTQAAETTETTAQTEPTQATQETTEPAETEPGLSLFAEPEIPEKNGAFCRVDVGGIDPYARTVKSGIIRKKRQHSQSGCCRKSAS